MLEASSASGSSASAFAVMLELLTSAKYDHAGHSTFALSHHCRTGRCQTSFNTLAELMNQLCERVMSTTTRWSISRSTAWLHRRSSLCEIGQVRMIFPCVTTWSAATSSNRPTPRGTFFPRRRVIIDRVKHVRSEAGQLASRKPVVRSGCGMVKVNRGPSVEFYIPNHLVSIGPAGPVLTSETSSCEAVSEDTGQSMSDQPVRKSW